jgi:GTP-binding protein Era
MDVDETKMIKCGFAALVGPPNAGKSTLLNALLGMKISIVSPKPQTTRTRILGIVNDPEYQIILLDTPGLHEAPSQLNQEMLRITVETLAEADVILYMIDATAALPKKGLESIAFLSKCRQPAILLINKIDLLAKAQLLPIMETYSKLHDFAAIIPLSARKGENTDLFIRELLMLLPSGPRLYPEDIPTDASERSIVAEIIREKVFLLTDQEIPYATAVAIDQFKEDEEKKLTTIQATIFIERTSQKAIVIGKGGSKLQQIGQAARKDIEELLGQHVLLKLWVKVQKNWTQDPRFLRELGFR